MDVIGYETCNGARVFQIPVQLFPILDGFAYFIDYTEANGKSYRVLIDTGSGFGESNQQITSGFDVISDELGQKVGLKDLTHILITHGHIDHFGGLSYMRPLTQAKIGIHELDLRIVTNYEEYLIIASRRLELFLIEAGIMEEQRENLMDWYLITKSLHNSVRVDFTFEKHGMELGPFKFLHVPGHSAGHVVIRIHDILFSGDHVLNNITPHQSPEHLSLSTGIEHYLASLDSLLNWADRIKLTLGGHEEPVVDLYTRVGEIKNNHSQRIQQILDLLSEPKTISEVANELFGDVYGYNTLLAIEEAGAHIEYLYQRGYLGIVNLDDLNRGNGPVPIRYICLPCQIAG